ncbi:MAG: MFS transporter [Candidatus Bipolaricaulis sibiricus]|uniref:MFS transporter n=1 Tax=Bipolaricaulis sibiricus TaxID=2501609 RepID=A0A410FWL7_BIPS1|nr:MAG: MFS transporter [Candidatus Bipolaricaulis sibiricus]
MAEARVFGLPADKGRWGFVGLGFVANVCMGAVYAFSVFRKPLEELWGITATESGLPFMVFLALFALGMALAGGLVENWGPRKTGILGGILVGLGWVLAGFSPNVGLLTLFYGVIGGAGVGVAYGCPIAVAGRWFPDRRGLALGLTLAGFGASALVVAPIMNALIAAQGPLRTFTIMGIAFLAVIVLASLPMRFPPRDAKTAPATGKARPSGVDFDRGQMVRTPTFWALWGVYTIGCLAGLMAIGIAAPFGREVAQLSAGLSAAAVSVFAVFNGVGRPVFGWLTDRLTPRYAGTLSFALILVASLLLWRAGASQVAYFVGFSVLWLNLGGWLAIAPAATATLFGTGHYAKNYGIMFTAYGVGAILGNVMSGLLRDLTSSYVAVFPPVMALAALGAVVALVGLPRFGVKVKGK